MSRVTTYSPGKRKRCKTFCPSLVSPSPKFQMKRTFSKGLPSAPNALPDNSASAPTTAVLLAMISTFISGGFSALVVWLLLWLDEVALCSSVGGLLLEELGDEPVALAVRGVGAAVIQPLVVRCAVSLVVLSPPNDQFSPLTTLFISLPEEFFKIKVAPLLFKPLPKGEIRSAVTFGTVLSSVRSIK